MKTKHSGYFFFDVSVPKPGLVVYGPAYWLCKDGDPTQALFYGMFNSPQANQTESIIDWMIDKDPKKYEELNVKKTFIEIAFVPQRG